MQVWRCPKGCTTLHLAGTIGGVEAVGFCSVCGAELRRAADEPDRPPLTLIRGGRS